MKAFLATFQGRPLMDEFPTTKLDHIIDTVYFGDSKESRALQIADACNYIIRRHLAGKPDAASYFNMLVPQLQLGPILFAPKQNEGER